MTQHLPERSTRQKRALTRVLDRSGAFRSAQDIYADLRGQGTQVGLTTVYNQLRALAQAGEVDVLRAPDGEALYRRCSGDRHHHHLLCRRCGRAVEVEGPEVEEWVERVAKANDFVDLSHTLEVVGVCGTCANRPTS